MSAAIVDRINAASDPTEQLRIELLAAALDYAAQGQRIFPVSPADVRYGPKAKQPVVRWGDRATTDPDQIRSWWSLWPYAIGLPTGLLFDVLDVDCKPGRPNGYLTLRRLHADAKHPVAHAGACGGADAVFW